MDVGRHGGRSQRLLGVPDEGSDDLMSLPFLGHLTQGVGGVKTSTSVTSDVSLKLQKILTTASSGVRVPQTTKTSVVYNDAKRIPPVSELQILSNPLSLLLS